MTAAQVDFVLELERLVDALPERYVGDPYFGEIFKASARGDGLEVARIAGMMIVELEVRGKPVSQLAQRWTDQFGDGSDVESVR